MAHGLGGTRDSGLLPYAERFAGAGLDALVFDYRHFGVSSGEPRQLLSMLRQRRDYHAAIAHARGLDGVDSDRIVLWGTSYSGGHVICVGSEDPRVAAVVAQTPMVDGVAALRNLVEYAGLGQLVRLTVEGLRDVADALLGREPRLVPVVGPPGSFGAMTTEDAEPGYRRIAGPSWRNELCVRGTLEFAVNRPIARAARVGCPLLVQVAAEDSVAPAEAARRAARRADLSGRCEVRGYPIGHFDIYVGDGFERAVTDQIDFLSRRLAQGSPRRAVAATTG
jgi:pimeloyl-ACP methyl ester carboxylesterase